MAEMFFIATTIFVAYVIFEVIGKDKPETKESPKPEPSRPEPVAATAKPSTPQTSVSAQPKPVAKKTPKPAKKTAPSKAAKTIPATNSLKNPKTGEVAKIPSNYAFAKRWIKEALVEEGLLDKIYKNNELDDNAAQKIKAALQQLQSMDKYQ